MGWPAQADRLRLNRGARNVRAVAAALGLWGGSLAAGAAESPMADVHLHFNWNQEEVTEAEQAVARLREQNVVLAVVTATPAHNALKLRRAGGDWILPIISPYLEVKQRQTWHVHPEIVPRIRAALESGDFVGIGEVHVIAGYGPRTDNPVLRALLGLAREFDVPFLIHTDSSDYRHFEAICRSHPHVRFLWAHAGGQLGPEDVRALLESCGNVWVELSARDPWHYGYLVDGDGRLLPGWSDLVTRFSDRFMTGTDPVWNAHQMYRWYEADEGWQHYAELNQWHRRWIEQLPAAVQQKVRLTNAQRFFGVSGRLPQ